MNKYLPIFLLLFVFFLASCGKQETPQEQLRSIRAYTITARAKGQIRKFTGVVYAVNYTYLSFEDVSGRIIELNADIGDEVSRGEVLAVLDKQKYELDVKNAQAELKKAEAALAKSTADYEREKILFEKDVSFQRRLDAREYQYKASISEKASARAALGLAERNLRNTDLKSPYDGFIGERFVQPNQEVLRTQKVFRIDEKGEMEVQFDIPESLRKRLNLDDEGVVTFPGHRGIEVYCKISFIGSAASKANAFPAKAVLVSAPVTVKPGMTAEVSFSLPVDDAGSGFVIPADAVLIGEEKKTGFVFVYNPASSTVRKTKVHFKGAQGNYAIVAKGLKVGDVIAVSGVSFLLDGMKVKLFKPLAPK